MYGPPLSTVGTLISPAVNGQAEASPTAGHTQGKEEQAKSRLSALVERTERSSTSTLTI